MRAPRRESRSEGLLWTTILILLVIGDGPGRAGKGAANAYKPSKCEATRTGLSELPSSSGLDIRCRDVDLTNRQDEKKFFEFLDQQRKICRHAALKLEGFVFPDGALPDKWFCIETFQALNIRALEVDGGLWNMSDDGLDCLPDLRALTLVSSHVHHIRKKSFRHVRELNRLELRSNFHTTAIERGLLADMTGLQILQVQGVRLSEEETRRFFANLTAEKGALRVEIVDWSHNNMGTFPGEVLLPSVRSLVATSSNIKDFDVLEFPRLESLVVTNNLIRFLPEDKYRPLIERLRSFSIKENPIVCDCDMVWLQKYILETRNGSYGDFNKVLCREPPRLENKPFLEVDMCPTTTTQPTFAPTTDTTERTPPTTPTPPGDCPALKIICHSNQNITKQPELIENIRTRLAGDEEVSLRPGKQNFSITHEENSNKLSIQIHNGNGTSKSLLYWANSKTKPPQNFYNCVTDITMNFTLSAEYDTDYMVCVFDRSENISLLDCKPFRTERHYSNQPWLTNNMKLRVSTIAGVVLLSALFTGGAITYCLVRHNPTLVGGSKRAINVTGHETIFPEGNGNSAPGSTHIKDQDPQYRDSCSSGSYIEPIAPRPVDILEFNLQKLKDRRRPVPAPFREAVTRVRSTLTSSVDDRQRIRGTLS